jgi:hypothetical protein
MSPPDLADSRVIARRDDLLTTEFEGEVVILNLRDGVYYSLEDAGARVWALLCRPVTIAWLCDTIVSEYEVDRDRCIRDLRLLMRDLAARNLVTIRSA